MERGAADATVRAMQQRTAAALTDSPARSWFVERVAMTLHDPRAALVERRGGGGAMAPLHARDEDETYRVEEGVVTFFVGRRP